MPEASFFGVFADAVPLESGSLPTTGGGSTGLTEDGSSGLCELHIVNSSGNNILVDVETGHFSVGNALKADAAAKAPPCTDPNQQPCPQGNMTYFIDSITDAVYQAEIPFLGSTALTMVGTLDMDTTSSVGLDFSKKGDLFVTLTLNGETHSNLYRIDMQTGKPTLIMPLDSVIESIATAEDFTLSSINPPATKINLNKTNMFTGSATISRDGNPVANVPVNIDVKGVNNFTIQNVTNSEGNVTIEYANLSGNPGLDTITVSSPTSTDDGLLQIGEQDTRFFPSQATVEWTTGPIIDKVKVKGNGNNLVLTGAMFRADDRVFINGVEVPANLVKFKNNGKILLKLKSRKGEFLNPCVNGGSENRLTVVNSEGGTEEASFIACP